MDDAFDVTALFDKLNSTIPDQRTGPSEKQKMVLHINGGRPSEYSAGFRNAADMNAFVTARVEEGKAFFQKWGAPPADGKASSKSESIVHAIYLCSSYVSLTLAWTLLIRNDHNLCLFHRSAQRGECTQKKHAIACLRPTLTCSKTNALFRIVARRAQGALRGLESQRRRGYPDQEGRRSASEAPRWRRHDQGPCAASVQVRHRRCQAPDSERRSGRFSCPFYRSRLQSVLQFRLKLLDYNKYCVLRSC